MRTNNSDGNINENCQLASYKSKHENDDTPVKNPDEIAEGKQKLQSWINKHMKIEMTDGRILIGMFLCTDRDGNVILGSCSEYLNPEVCGFSDEPRLLGLVMVPGRHIVNIHFDSQPSEKDIT
ncbi:N-alpha-acetyltransferase 38-B, NatC auxiliary subunit-like isoform X1 [Macrosteles quadrilineatus]|uniref:N-alpha-acetyltransferase 38-B, NatC auxiliary subunit-like isoform X1 n=1 Tax=Macrosteles quadrilineatus TaxID=74068 RepID=UPI0023E0BA3E|nr:N-alpha-acetyltransferase 38-B, NatC auxiliary subunit-like isoform X1 [Macrosteles quadrilineatus]